jgi:hypothetical protein
MVVAANYRELNKKCPNCVSRNQFNEISYDTNLEYYHPEMSLKCDKCQYVDYVKPHIIVVEVEITPSQEILILSKEDENYTSEIRTRLYLAANIKHEPLTKINTNRAGRYLIHVYYKKCDGDPSYIIDVLYSELIESYYASCAHCGDEFIRDDMCSGIIYGFDGSNNKNKIDGKFLLCKKHFNELKTYIG